MNSKVAIPGTGPRARVVIEFREQASSQDIAGVICPRPPPAGEVLPDLPCRGIDHTLGLQLANAISLVFEEALCR